MAKAAREVFISYSREDAAFVLRLTRALDQQGVTYWSDREIHAGASWIEEIELAIKRASVFVLVISRSFTASDFAQFEAGMAVGRARESGAVIVPVLLPGVSLPSVLRDYQALRADLLTAEDVAAQLGAIVATVDRKADRIVKEVRIFVSSPGDVVAERECVARVIEDLNGTLGAIWEVALRRYSWESSPDILTSVPAIGGFDVFLLILAARIGTPIAVGRGSGVEEEFQIALQSYRHTGKPQILCYLKTAAVRIQSMEQVEQLRRVLEFRDRLKADGLIYEFESIDDFERSVRFHLQNIIASAAGRITSG